MVTKGHHFPNLTLVGVVDADLGLNGGDLRAAERTFQLLYQVAGRAGREREAGPVLVQTHVPEHPVMQALVSGDRDRFVAAELEARRAAGMPPFGRLAVDDRLRARSGRRRQCLPRPGAPRAASGRRHHPRPVDRAARPAARPPSPALPAESVARYRSATSAAGPGWRRSDCRAQCVCRSTSIPYSFM